MELVFREGGAPPAWCELAGFAILDLGGGARRDCARLAGRERLVVAAGTCRVAFGGRSQVLKENQFFDLPEGTDAFELSGHSPAAQLVRLSGGWGDELGGCGVFRARDEAQPSDSGDPVDYAKSTSVDSHYHDCDEYWIVLEGRAECVVGRDRVEVRAGDCLAIRTGHRHDMPRAPEPVKAVFFETTLKREKRIGHLWQHTHGAARPEREAA